MIYLLSLLWEGCGEWEEEVLCIIGIMMGVVWWFYYYVLDVFYLLKYKRYGGDMGVGVDRRDKSIG